MPPAHAPADDHDQDGLARAGLAVLDRIEAATDRLLRTVDGMDRTARALPSRCPGWSRAHVVAHLTRNADALGNLLSWAATGVPTPMYDSAQARIEGIASSAQASPEQAGVDLRAAAGRFAGAVRSLPAASWTARVPRGHGGTGPEMAVADVPWHRLKEVEIHHVDLNLDYTPAHWPADFVERMLDEAVASMAARPEVPRFSLRRTDSSRERPVGALGGPVVAGPPAALLSWLLGRSDGEGLAVEGAVEGADALPRLPAWG
jgi:maleylpyruvate isomerase